MLNIYKIPTDKLLHFIAGTIITMIFSFFFPMTVNYCVIFAIIAGVSKEVYDKTDYGLFDWWDVVATSLGGLLIQIYLWL